MILQTNCTLGLCLSLISLACIARRLDKRENEKNGFFRLGISGKIPGQSRVVVSSYLKKYPQYFFSSKKWYLAQLLKKKRDDFIHNKKCDFSKMLFTRSISYQFWRSYHIKTIFSIFHVLKLFSIYESRPKDTGHWNYWGKSRREVYLACRGAFFVWHAPILSWPRIMCPLVHMLKI